MPPIDPIDSNDPLDPISQEDPTVPDPAKPHPRLIAPIQGEAVDGHAATFEWTLVPDVTIYRLRISRDADFMDLHLDTEVAGATSLAVYDLAQYEGQTLYWQIEAHVREGNVLLSAAEPFVVQEEGTVADAASLTAPGAGGAVPAAPDGDSPRLQDEDEPESTGSGNRIVNLVAPVDGALTDALATTLQWEPVAEASEYHVQLADDAAFTNLGMDESVGQTTTITLYDMISRDEALVYWRVFARIGESWAESAVETFRAVIDFTERVHRQVEQTVSTSPTPTAVAAPMGVHSSAVYTEGDSAMTLVWIWSAISLAAAALIILKVLGSGA